MDSFNLQDWLDDQLEHNILNEPVRPANFQDGDVAGFGFPYYASLEASDISNPSVNHLILL